MIDATTFEVITALQRLLDEVEFDIREDFEGASKEEKQKHPFNDIALLRCWLAGDLRDVES